MKIALTKHQRYAALAGCAAIILVLLSQLSKNGYHGYGWAWALLFAAGLGILGVGPTGTNPVVDGKAAPAPPKGPRYTDAEIEAFHAQYRENAVVLAAEVEERSKAIATDFERVRSGIKLTNDDGTPWKLDDAMGGFIRDRALMTALALVATRRAEGNNLYITALEYKETEKRIFTLLAKSSIAAITGIGETVKNDVMTKSILDELVTVRRAVSQAALAQKNGSPDVSKPIVDWIEKQGLKITDRSLITNALLA